MHPKRLYGGSSVMVLIIAMTVVAMAFVFTIVYLETSTMHVRRETHGMLSNGAPSIDYLTDARTSLRQLDGAMDRALLVLVAHRPVDVSAVTQARTRLSEDLAAYRRYPFYALEAEMNRELDVELRRLDDVQRRLLEQIQRRDLQAALELDVGEWRNHSDAVDNELRGLTEFNLRHVVQHATRIDHLRRRSALVGVGVGGGAVLLGLAATIVAARAVRRQTVLQEERARELEMFSARVAHDLMSPLLPVSMALEVANDQVQDAAAQRMIGRARSALKRIRLIVDGLLDFARAGGKPSADACAPVPKVLGDVLDEVKPHAEQAGIELCFDGAPPVEVACSPGILAVVVGNLVNNAVKYMADSRERRVVLRAKHGHRCVCFEVEDTGPGLPPGLETAAFEPYVRGNDKAAGIGLGLATVKRFVEAHGGRVGVKRRADGCGAIFWFELPVAKRA